MATLIVFFSGALIVFGNWAALTPKVTLMLMSGALLLGVLAGAAYTVPKLRLAKAEITRSRHQSKNASGAGVAIILGIIVLGSRSLPQSVMFWLILPVYATMVSFAVRLFFVPETMPGTTKDA
jgi:hypothetical protein